MRGRILLLACCLLPAAFCLAGCATPARPAPSDVDYAVGEFSFTERGGRTVTREDLLGKIWVASFIFTRCSGPCPQITANMARLQGELAGDDNVALVTFTVDPRYDTPKVLRAYAARYGADPQRWLFLTGDQDKLYALIRNSFKSGVEQRQGAERTPGNEVLHRTSLYVVDRKGHFRAYFDGRQVDEDGKPIDKLPDVRAKIAELEREKR